MYEESCFCRACCVIILSIEPIDVDNLFRKNMMNVREKYKTNPNRGVYDRDFDSYCSLIKWADFISDLGDYIDIACSKRDKIEQYNIVKWL